MALPSGNLNLQQVVRDLEKRIEAIEGHPALSVPSLDAPAVEATNAGQEADTGSTPEPPAND